MARDYYGILGVDPKATDQEIKRSYRKLARELHPDVNPDPGAQERFAEVTTAYEVLSDPEKRRVVDLGGDPLGGGGRAGAQDFGGFGFGSGGLGDVFEAFFGGGAGGGRGPRPRVQPGEDAALRLKLTLEECATGVTKQIVVDTAVLCEGCGGSGSADDTPPQTCTTCKGAGHVQMVQRSMLGNVMTTQICPTCSGFGDIILNKCTTCSGDGRVRARRTVGVKVPRGVDHGMRIRLAGQGEVGLGGGPAGSLYVEVIQAPHAVFTRDGDDLHCAVRVPMLDAALGTTVPLTSVTGDELSLDIEAGTQPGAEVRLRGAGVPSLGDGRPGDIIAHVEVVVPEKLDRKDREKLAELRERLAQDGSHVVENDASGGRREGVFSRFRSAFTGH